MVAPRETWVMIAAGGAHILEMLPADRKSADHVHSDRSHRQLNDAKVDLWYADIAEPEPTMDATLNVRAGRRRSSS
jgi:hypothetical protein